MTGRTAQLIVALVLAGAWGLLLAAGHLRGELPVLERLEATLTDFRLLLRGERQPAGAVAIVAIDDATVQRAGRFPVPRAVLADLLSAIASHEPAVTALDVLLVDEGPADEDRELAEALAGSPTVIAGAAVFEEMAQTTPGEGPLAGVPVAARLLLPRQSFLDRASLGIVNVATDRNGTPRFVPMLFRTSDRLEISLPLRAAASALGEEPVLGDGALRLGERRIATDIGYRLPLAFFGGRGTIPTFSAADLLDGTVAPEALRGQVVVVGATVTGGGDVFPTPFDPVLPGVEVIATAVSHLIAGDALVRDRNVRRIDAAIAVVLPMVLVALIGWRRNVIGIAAVGAVLTVWAIGNVAAFDTGYWLSAAVPLAAAAPPALIYGAAQLLQGRQRATFFETQSAMLQRIQAAGLSQWLARDPDFLSEPVRQDAAVVFVDLSGFTGLSETLGPVATRELLDSFYDLVDREVTACHGAVTSFMGDGAMILFGLPEPTAGDAANAAECAVRLCLRLREWLDRRGETRIGFKLGAHFGSVVASRLGRGSNQQIATTGDTVNVASRLMEFAKENGAELAVSEDLLREAGRTTFDRGTLDGPAGAHLRGRAGTLSVWLWRPARQNQSA
ncbi:CHASE2 domain-containing protein [Aquibium oceanicum]|uniref:CHASE2 domain-containing protein n=1 Tax=Aquibium oceanicum TaxID=1670800 RepID=UPI000A5A9E45|nr:adenylate/guanylate cyclase domain-containing protein [Aquibium oceanicum]